MARFSLSRSIACLSFFVFGVLAQSQQSCYFPNGDPDPTGVPCNSSATNSHCCSAQGLCLSNGLCFLQTELYSNRLSRQSCTDRSWQSSSCPQYCTDTYNEHGTTIWLGPENANGAFCCGQPYNVSSEECVLASQGSTQPFNLPPGNAYFDREGRNSTDPAAFGQASGQTSSASSSATATGAAVTAATTASSNDSNSDVVAVGVGVGVALGVCLLVAVGLLIWQWRKSIGLQKQLNELQSQQSTVGGGMGQTYQHPGAVAWGGASGFTSPAPAYSEPRKSQSQRGRVPEANGIAQAGELPATQQIIPELDNGEARR